MANGKASTKSTAVDGCLGWALHRLPDRRIEATTYYAGVNGLITRCIQVYDAEALYPVLKGAHLTASVETRRAVLAHLTHNVIIG